ncbi:hypothetical protein QCA50_006248 [Cerrena zonata]|uniref:Uncharacterized protein n=1 Tax=Cerrena zonata TaxID=2478898 RepID=A0AAW0GIW2_9APHY
MSLIVFNHSLSILTPESSQKFSVHLTRVASTRPFLIPSSSLVKKLVPFLTSFRAPFLPSLAHVELRGYPVPWSLPFLHTHLSSLVIDHFNDASSKPSVFTVTSPMKELLICLSYMPRLRFLDVNAEHCYNDCELVDSFANNMPFVELSCLEEVSMKLEVASVFEFVTHCKFPTSARRSFVTTVRHSHPPKGVADDDSLSSIVISSTPFSSDIPRVEDREPPITGLSIVFHSPPPIVFHSPFFSPPSLLPMGLEEHRMCRVSIATHRCNFQLDDTTYAFPRHSLPPTHFSLEFDSLNSVVIALLNLFTQPPFKLSDLAYLNIHGEQQDQWEQIGPVLGAALTQLIRQCSKPCLEFLHLSGSGVDILLHLLTSFTLPSPSQKGDGSRSLFSHVRTLVINKTIGGYMWHSCKTDGARMDDLCAEIHSQVELYEWSSGPFTTLILEFVSISRERLRRLVHSFSQLFGQEGRYVAIEGPPETDSMPPTPTMPPTVPPTPTLPPTLPSTPLAPLKPLPGCLEVNDLDELNLETCVELEFEDGEKIYRLPTEHPPPVPRSRPVLNPVDWRDYATHGRVVFDFKNVEMKIVRRHQLQVERAV